MKKYEARDIALKCRADHGLGAGPVDVTGLAGNMGIHIETMMLHPMIAGEITGNRMTISSDLTNVPEQKFGNFVIACLVSAKLLGLDYALHKSNVSNLSFKNEAELLIYICAMNLLVSDDSVKEISEVFGHNMCETALNTYRKYDEDSGRIAYNFGITERAMELRLYQAGLLSRNDVLRDTPITAMSNYQGINPDNYEQYIDSYIINDEPIEDNAEDWIEFENF